MADRRAKDDRDMLRRIESDGPAQVEARRELVDAALALVLQPRPRADRRDQLRARIARALPALAATVDHPIYPVRIAAERAVDEWKGQPLSGWPERDLAQALADFFGARSDAQAAEVIE